MKIFEKIFRGKISYKKIDKCVNLVRKTLDPDDMAIEFDLKMIISILKLKYLIECYINGNWQIILAIIIVGLSIVIPIYYSYKKKKLERKLKEESNWKRKNKSLFR